MLRNTFLLHWLLRRHQPAIITKLPAVRSRLHTTQRIQRKAFASSTPSLTSKPPAPISSPPPSNSTASSPPTFRRTLLGLGIFLTWTPALLFFVEHVYQIMWIKGPSMTPFFNTDYNSSSSQDVVLVKMWKPSEDLHRGSVVAFWSPSNPQNMAVKRVIALEGDTVVTKRPYPFETEVVKHGHVWVEGENPDERYSLDSNTYGAVSRSLIVGKVQAVVWPWRKVGWVRWQDWRGKGYRVVEAGPEWKGEDLPYGLTHK